MIDERMRHYVSGVAINESTGTGIWEQKKDIILQKQLNTNVWDKRKHKDRKWDKMSCPAHLRTDRPQALMSVN
jgi:hypothetical protein